MKYNSKVLVYIFDGRLKLVNDSLRDVPETRNLRIDSECLTTYDTTFASQYRLLDGSSTDKDGDRSC